MQTLQNIISIQIRCFKKEGIKKFIFCLRDFDEEHESLGDLESTIRESMAEIWAQIKKPEKGMKSRDVYSIEVFPFRSFRTNQSGFYEDCAKMRSKLETYRKFSVNNLPLDGLVHYLKSSWNIIQSNKDLNIPDQKRIVANVRCREEAQMIHKEGSSEIEKIKKNIGRKSINTLISSIKGILKKSHKEYDENTTYYDEKAKEEHRKELQKSLGSDMKSFVKLSFENQEQKLISEIEMMINKYNQKKDVGMEAFNDFREKKIDLYVQLDKHKGIVQIGDINPEETCREKKMKILQHLKIGLGNLYVKIIDNLVKNKMKEIRKQEEDFYENFNQDTFERIISETEEAYQFLSKNLQEANDEDPELFSEINEEFFKNLKKKIYGRIEEKLIEMNYFKIIVRSFKKRFTQNKNNIPRNWKKLTTDEINTLYNLERKTILKKMSFLGEDIFINSERIKFKTEYFNLKEDIEVELKNIYNAAIDKHLAANAFQAVPKVY